MSEFDKATVESMAQVLRSFGLSMRDLSEATSTFSASLQQSVTKIISMDAELNRRWYIAPKKVQPIKPKQRYVTTR